MKYTISVLVPVYNAARYLPDCLDALRLQTFTDFEIICLDGRSTDGSLKILQSFAAHEPRARIVSQVGADIAAARNRLLQEASGEYIAFVDADDKVLPQYLEKLYQAAQTERADVVKCSLCDMSEDGKTIRPSRREYPFPKGPSLKERFLCGYSRHEVWGKLFRTQFIREKNIHFTPGHLAEDISFTVGAFILADRLACVQEKLYLYRQGIATSIMGRKGTLITVDVLRELLVLRDVLKQAQAWPVDLAKAWIGIAVWRLGMFCKFPPEVRHTCLPLAQQVFDALAQEVAHLSIGARWRWGSLLQVAKRCGPQSIYRLCKIWR